MKVYANEYGVLNFESGRPVAHPVAAIARKILRPGKQFPKMRLCDNGFYITWRDKTGELDELWVGERFPPLQVCQPDLLVADGPIVIELSMKGCGYDSTAQD